MLSVKNKTFSIKHIHSQTKFIKVTSCSVVVILIETEVKITEKVGSPHGPKTLVLLFCVLKIHGT